MKTVIFLQHERPGPWARAIMEALRHPMVERHVIGTPSDEDVAASIKVSPSGEVVGLRVAFSQALGLRVFADNLADCPFGDEVLEVVITDDDIPQSGTAHLREARGRFPRDVAAPDWHSWDIKAGFVNRNPGWVMVIHASSLDRARAAYDRIRYPLSPVDMAAVAAAG